MASGGGGGADDWDDVPAPQSRSDRIQRITSPDHTLQRPPPSGSSMARAAQLQQQQQQLQLTMALMQQQQQAQQLGLHGLLDPHHHHHPPIPPAPSHIASLRRQAQYMAMVAAAQSHTGSLPRSQHGGHQPMFSIPASPTSSRGMRYRSPATSLPPTTGPLRPAQSPNLSSARRLSQQRSLELSLEPRHLDSLPRRSGMNNSSGSVNSRAGPAGAAHWGEKGGQFDPFLAAAAAHAQQQAIYSGDGSTSSYARVAPHNGHNRQTYPPQLSSASQVKKIPYFYSLDFPQFSHNFPIHFICYFSIHFIQFFY